MNAKWIRKISLLIALFFALSLSLQIADAADEICDGLMSLRAKHGIEFEAYLSDAGKNCLVASAPFVFERSFVGTQQIPVVLHFIPGIYQFKLNIPNYNSDRSGNIWYIGLSDVVEAPENCIPKAENDTIYFPSLIQIREKCKVQATLREVGSFSDRKYKVSISRFSTRAPAKTLELWTRSGMGRAYNKVDLALSPGLYRLNLHSPDEAHLGKISLDDIISDPPGCIGLSRIEFPSQVRVNQACRLYAILNSYLVIDLIFWNVSINRIE